LKCNIKASFVFFNLASNEVTKNNTSK